MCSHRVRSEEKGGGSGVIRTHKRAEGRRKWSDQDTQKHAGRSTWRDRSLGSRMPVLKSLLCGLSLREGGRGSGEGCFFNTLNVHVNA